MNMRLNCVNLFVNYSNILNTNQLRNRCNQFEEEIETGKRVISSLNDRVNDQEGEISNLNQKVSVLDSDLLDHKERLNKACEKYYNSISELETNMNFQKEMIKKFEERTLKEDLAIDTLISLVSLIFVNTSFVDFPIKLIGSILITKNNKRYLLPVSLVKIQFRC